MKNEITFSHNPNGLLDFKGGTMRINEKVLSSRNLAQLRKRLVVLDKKIYKLKSQQSKIELLLLTNSGTSNSYRTYDRY